MTPTNLRHEKGCEIFADVNGDGMPDAIYLDPPVRVRLNLGNGTFLRPASWIDDTSFGQRCQQSDPTHDPPTRVLDIDGDCHDDLMMFIADQPGQGSSTTWLLLSRADHFEVMQAPINGGSTTGLSYGNGVNGVNVACVLLFDSA